MSLFDFLKEYQVRPEIEKLLDDFRFGFWERDSRDEDIYYRSFSDSRFPLINFNSRFGNHVYLSIDKDNCLKLTKKETRKFVKIRNLRSNKMKWERERELLYKLKLQLNNGSQKAKNYEN